MLDFNSSSDEIVLSVLISLLVHNVPLPTSRREGTRRVTSAIYLYWYTTFHC